jgi:hypothetical protein
MRLPDALLRDLLCAIISNSIKIPMLCIIKKITIELDKAILTVNI